MASITKNLDTIIAQAINGPKVDGVPLYARVDGEQETGFNRKEERSAKWETASKTSYTSPTNIRRVFISGTKVVVQTYKPVIIRAKPDPKGCWREFKLTGGNNLIECVRDMCSYNHRLEMYYVAKREGREIDKPDQINIRGTGLRALSSPWVLSNIEEVYFDWTLLASENNRNAAIGCDEILEAYISGKRGAIKSNIPVEMFTLANMGNVKDIRNRYPRLKVVGLISELGKILDVKYDKGKPGLDSVEDSNKMWYRLDTNVELIKQSNSLIIINELRGDIPRYNTNFAVRDGIYKYDRDILSNYFSAYEKKVKEYLRKKPDDEEVTVDCERTVKSELEELLDDVVVTRSMADAKSILLLTLTGYTLKEIDGVFSEMSTEGEKKYRELIK